VVVVVAVVVGVVVGVVGVGIVGAEVDHMESVIQYMGI
jgi:hypothetical protein